MMQELHKNLIGGQWTGDEANENRVSSKRDKVVGLHARASRTDVDCAIAAAWDAFGS